jgi:hypothetical protein
MLHPPRQETESFVRDHISLMYSPNWSHVALLVHLCCQLRKQNLVSPIRHWQVYSTSLPVLNQEVSDVTDPTLTRTAKCPCWPAYLFRCQSMSIRYVHRQSHVNIFYITVLNQRVISPRNDRNLTLRAHMTRFWPSNPSVPLCWLQSHPNICFVKVIVNIYSGLPLNLTVSHVTQILLGYSQIRVETS